MTAEPIFSGLMSLPAWRFGVIMFAYVVGAFLQLFWFFKLVRGALKALRPKLKSSLKS